MEGLAVVFVFSPSHQSSIPLPQHRGALWDYVLCLRRSTTLEFPILSGSQTEMASSKLPLVVSPYPSSDRAVRTPPAPMVEGFSHKPPRSSIFGWCRSSGSTMRYVPPNRAPSAPRGQFHGNQKHHNSAEVSRETRLRPRPGRGGARAGTKNEVGGV